MVSSYWFVVALFNDGVDSVVRYTEKKIAEIILSFKASPQ